MSVKISKQTQAEKDDYLFECFYDAGFINDLIANRYSIVSGRKGSGKTALARYLESRFEVHGIDLAHRLSIRGLSINSGDKREERLNVLLSFVLIKTVSRLLDAGLFDKKGQEYWLEFFEQNGLQGIDEFNTFVELRRTQTTGFSIKGFLKSIGIGVEASTTAADGSEYSRAVISKAPHALYSALSDSLPPGRTVMIFIDDLSDYLDESSQSELVEDIALIKNFLLALDDINSTNSDKNRDIQFISLIRQDLFEFMEGSNLNKLVTNSLEIKWSERDFASLLIKRLPCYADSQEADLANPIEAIRRQFPDEIFTTALEQFETNRQGTNFYAYMVAVSFNRPRDFLKFCYAMRNRLSESRPASFENIESAEIEYTDYFVTELRDELYLASRILHFADDADGLNRLIDLLNQRNGFNPSQLRTDLGQYLGEKSKVGRNRTEHFISELWRYGVIGYKREGDKIIHFRYLSTAPPLVLERIKDYVFYLHRGLWWFARKRRADKVNARQEDAGS